jgi:ASC-1-like (ASCH) protein
MNKKIGQIIKEHLESSGMEVVSFAKAINKERSNVYDIFKRDSIDTNLLKKIGQVLDYDFFQDLLDEKTIEKIRISESIKKSKVLIEVDISDEEIMKIGFTDKVFKILNK